MIIQDNVTYDKFIEDILNSSEKYLGIDTETEPFSKQKTRASDLKLEGVGVYANKKLKAYILPEILNANFQKVLDSKEIIFHNAKFDLVILKKEGFDIDTVNYHDTLIMSWLCNENRFSNKLKDLAHSVLKVKEEKITRFKDIEQKPDKEQFGLFGSKDFDGVLQEWIKQIGFYCLKDCKYTKRLFLKFKPILEKEEIWKEYEELELPFLKVLLSIEERGVKIDTDYLSEVGEKLDNKIIEISADIYKEVGREIDINSAKQLREYLFKEKKYNLPKQYRTPKGEFSTNVSALEYLKKEKVKIAELILKYRELSKLNSTYVKGMLLDVKDNTIHTNFNQTGTKTGRLSSSSPNLQNIPRRDDDFNIRKAFIPRKGYKFISADYSQIELRLMAYFSKDERMLKVYADNGDIHAETAKEIGCSRVIAKGINFGINYGRTAYGLSEGLGISKKDAQTFINKYFSKYPKVKLFIQQAINTLKRKYVVRTLLKRKRRFPKYAQAKKEKNWKLIGQLERQSVNSIVQGSSADLIKVAMRNLALKLKKYDAYILIQIHDELICECPIKDLEKVKKIIKYEMENCIDLKIVKIIVEPKITDCWEK